MGADADASAPQETVGGDEVEGDATEVEVLPIPVEDELAQLKEALAALAAKRAEHNAAHAAAAEASGDAASAEDTEAATAEELPPLDDSAEIDVVSSAAAALCAVLVPAATESPASVAAALLSSGGECRAALGAALGAAAPEAATGGAPLFFTPGAVLDALVDGPPPIVDGAEDITTEALESASADDPAPHDTAGSGGTDDNVADSVERSGEAGTAENDVKEEDVPAPVMDPVEPVNGLVAVLASKTVPLPARFAALRALTSACTLRVAAATAAAADTRMPGALLEGLAHPAGPMAAKASRLAQMLAANAHFARAMMRGEAPVAEGGGGNADPDDTDGGDGAGEGVEDAASEGEGEVEGASAPDVVAFDGGVAAAAQSCAIVSALEACVRGGDARVGGKNDEGENRKDGHATDGGAATGAHLLHTARVLQAACSAGAAPATPAARVAVRALCGALGAERADVSPAAQVACADALRALVQASPNLVGDILRADVGAPAVPAESAGVLALCRESLEYEWIEYSPPPPPKKKTFGLLSAVVAQKLPEAPADAAKVRDGACGQPEVQVALLLLCGTLLAVGGSEVDDAFEVMAQRQAPRFAEVLELALTEHEVDVPDDADEDDHTDAMSGDDIVGGSGNGEGGGADGPSAENEGEAREAQGIEDDDSSDDEPPPPPPPPPRQKVSAPPAVRLAALEALAAGCMHPSVRAQLHERADTALAAAAATGALPGGPLVSEHLAILAQAIGGGASVLADLARDDRKDGPSALSGAARGALHAALLMLPEGDALAPPRPPPRSPSPPPAPPPVRFSRSLARMRRAALRRSADAVAASPEAEPAAA